MNLKTDPQTAARQQGQRQKQMAMESFAILRNGADAAPYVAESMRRQQLQALKQAIGKYQTRLLKAIATDFGEGDESQLIQSEIAPLLEAIRFNLKHLRLWMRPQATPTGHWFKPLRARQVAMPHGVVGIISPWYNPVLQALSPLVSAIAAGNRVMLKPSQNCPYTNRVINQILQHAFTPDEVVMIEGDSSVAAEFARLPFDHLLYAGAASQASTVLSLASERLTPVSLSLSGKTPLIIDVGVPAQRFASKLLSAKQAYAGQSETAPDYLLCPQDQVNSVVEALQQAAEGSTALKIANPAQFKRISDLLEDAQAKGASLYPVGKQIDGEANKLPLQLVTGVTADMAVMQAPIFGPILPIVGYDNLPQALDWLNQQHKPASVYLYSQHKRSQQLVLEQVDSASLSLNDFTISPYGVPVSRMGRGSLGGHNGFLTFSRQKLLLKRLWR